MNEWMKWNHGSAANRSERDACLRDEFSFSSAMCHSWVLFEGWQQMKFVGKAPGFACLCSLQRLWHLLPRCPPPSHQLEQGLANDGYWITLVLPPVFVGLVNKEWVLHFSSGWWRRGGKAKEEESFVQYGKITWNSHFSVHKNVGLEHAMLTCLCLLRGCFGPTTAESSSWDRGCKARKTKKIYCLVLYGKVCQPVI